MRFFFFDQNSKDYSFKKKTFETYTQFVLKVLMLEKKIGSKLVKHDLNRRDSLPKKKFTLKFHVESLH